MDHRLREELFRESVIAALVPKEKDRVRLESDYCKACKKAKPDLDCSKCDKSQIKVDRKEN